MSQPLPDFQTLKKQFDQAKQIREKEIKLKEKNGGPFRSIGLLMKWFAIITTLHVLGLYLFTNGFLLTRLVLNDQSECNIAPINTAYTTSSTGGCWHPKSFDQLVLIVIDALRYDFTIPVENSSNHYHNAFPILYETALKNPSNAILLPFIADPPTTTLQRLKGLTTGTLPTFIDAGSNFAGTSIEEDNLISQAANLNKTIVHLGDDTWHSLFPNHFHANLTKPYDSFNVWDLHTVDNGVIEHIHPLLQQQNKSQWDILIGHLLGVDHAGHRYGPDHIAMTDKLSQMNSFIESIIPKIDDQTLLVVMGDHGMDSKGDHGGESDEEIQAALWMFTKKNFFGQRSGVTSPSLTAYERYISQIDLVPTLAVLLGLPIPFNNLGSPIYEAFVGSSGTNFRNLATVSRLVSGQISRYMQRYSIAQNIDISKISSLWYDAESLSSKTSVSNFKQISEAYTTYQIEVLSLCKSLWAKFSLPSMLIGISILTFTLIIILVFYNIKVNNNINLITTNLITGSLITSVFSLISGYIIYFLFQTPFLPTFALALSFGISSGIIISFIQSWKRLSIPYPGSWASFISILFTIALSTSFASNSYTIWEDRITLFFLSSISITLIITSLRQEKSSDRSTGVFYSILFLILSRITSFSRLCREEQMPFCFSTYYASSNSSTSAAWHLIIPIVIALALPGIIKQFYMITQSYHHSAILWYGIAFRTTLWLSATFWLINTADDHNWLNISSISWIKDAKVIIAQTSIGIALVVGYSIHTWSAPFLTIKSNPISSPQSKNSSNVKNQQTVMTGIVSPDGLSRLVVVGSNNAHGTRLFPIISIWAAATILFSKPLGAGAIAILIIQILCFLEVLSATAKVSPSPTRPNLSSTASASSSPLVPLVPLTLTLLGSLHFFATGHQAVIASLQWDAAFVAVRSLQGRLIPAAAAMLLNTLGPQIICALAIPLVAAWRAPLRAGHDVVSEAGKLVAGYIAVNGTITLATSVWAMWLRRHLMLYRVFCPRYLLAAVSLVVVEVAIIGIGLLGVWTSEKSVASVLDLE